MGLGNGERIAGVTRIINRLYKINRFESYPFKSANEILDSLWFCLLSKTKNVGLWFSGSSIDSGIIEEESGLFGQAMLMGASNCEFNKPLKEMIEDGMEPNVAAFHDYIDNYAPNMERFLLKRSCEHAAVLKIFELTEHYFYYANRYIDDLSASFTELTKQVCLLQGFCYDQFSGSNDGDTSFVCAWMSGFIFSGILGDHNDELTMWFKNSNAHHIVDFKEMSETTLYEIFKKFQWFNISNPVSTNDRAEALTHFLPYKDYEVKNWKAFITTYNSNNEEDLIDADKINEILDAKEKSSKKDKPIYESRYCSLTKQFIK